MSFLLYPNSHRDVGWYRMSQAYQLAFEIAACFFIKIMMLRACLLLGPLKMVSKFSPSLLDMELKSNASN